MASNVLETIEERQKFLQNIIDGNIELIEGGNIRLLKDTSFFDSPCNIEKLIETFGGELKLLGQGTYGKAYKVCFDKECENNFVIKKIDMDVNDIYISNEYPNRPENVEIEIFKRLNKLLLYRVTPNIPFYLGDFICKESGNYYRYYIAERADGDLSKYISGILLKFPNFKISKTQKDKIWKSILFQLISVLYFIQAKYPRFRHNDLHPGNILYFNTKSEGNFEYVINNIKYIIPDVGIRLAIWDFDFSSIAGELDNVKTLDLQNEPFGIRNEANTYADMFKVINILLDTLLRCQQEFPSHVPNEAIEFMERIIPARLQGREVKYYVGNFSLIYDIKYLTPLDVLKDPYFDEYVRKDDISNSGTELIIESYNDYNINYMNNDMDVPNFNTNFKIPIQAKLDFKCLKYTPKLIDFNYKASRFDISRLNCFESWDLPDILTNDDLTENFKNNTELWLLDLIPYIEPLVKNSMPEHFKIHWNKFNTKSNIIISLTIILLLELIQKMIIPAEYFKLFALLCLEKAIFYIIHVHFLNGEGIEQLLQIPEISQFNGAIIYDTMIQLERFLILMKLEDKYLMKYQVTEINF